MLVIVAARPDCTAGRGGGFSASLALKPLIIGRSEALLYTHTQQVDFFLLRFSLSLSLAVSPSANGRGKFKTGQARYTGRRSVTQREASRYVGGDSFAIGRTLSTGSREPGKKTRRGEKICRPGAKVRLKF